MSGRSRLKSDQNSLGTISNPKDEGTGLTLKQLEDVEAKLASDGENMGRRAASRFVRPPTDGLLLIYPISRFSGFDKKDSQTRMPLYDNPQDPRAQDIIGIALSFPKSDNAQVVLGEYVVGTVGWRVYEQD